MFSTSEIEGRGGIYVIRCLANGKVYIGSSLDIYRRWKHHRNRLSKKPA
jgi:predicted GIY-YIG superfamily endonuclease